MDQGPTRTISTRVPHSLYEEIVEWRKVTLSERDVNFSLSVKRLIEQGLKEKQRKAGR